MKLSMLALIFATFLTKNQNEACENGKRAGSLVKQIFGAKTKMIIITDAGIDDADAIILALSHKKVHVLAIMTVFGIVERDKVTINVNRILRLFPEKNVPVYAGSKVPLGSAKSDVHIGKTYNGDDGLGDVPKVFPEITDSDKEAVLAAVPEKTASDAIFEIIRDNPGTIVVCLAPLTDLALAIRKHREDVAWHKNLKRLYVMGANIPVTDGTSTKAAKNLREDAIAAAIVLTELKSPITLISRESYSGNTTSKEFEKKYMNFEKTHVGKFVKAIRTMYLARLGGPPTIFDELAMAAAIDPSIMKADRATAFVSVTVDEKLKERISEPRGVAVDEKLKGQVVFDKQSGGEQQNVEFVYWLNWRKVENMLVKSLKHKTILPKDMRQ